MSLRKGNRREKERALIKKRTNKKSDILLQMMGDLDFDFIHIGDAILAEIDDERHVAIGLANGTTANRWEGIRLKLVSKKRGLLDICEIPFVEAFANLVDETHPNRLEKYVWKYNGDINWYGKPTAADLKGLRNQIRYYLELVR